MFLIIGRTSTKQIWENLENNYLQVIKDKKLQLKQQIQSIKMSSVDKDTKEFREIFVSFTTIHKPLEKDNRVINFAKCLGNKYKILKIFILKNCISSLHLVC